MGTPLDLHVSAPRHWTVLIAATIVGLSMLVVPSDGIAQSLRGSRASLDRQNRQAHLHKFTYLRRPGQLQRFLSAGLLVPVEGNEHYRLIDVSYRAARPEVRLFVERLALQHHRKCGTPLIVTSLIRPISEQPKNASARSVHPTGMALDLRRPTEPRCRSWLTTTLLSLENARVLEATLESSPPHLHVAVFPKAYVAYVARMSGRSKAAIKAGVRGPTEHTVQRGESLSQIAADYGTTAVAIRRSNRLRSNVIHPGQVLRLPSTRR
jgi:hypothetical protein